MGRGFTGLECPKCRYISLPGSHFCEKCGYDLKAFRARRTSAPVSGSASRGPAPAPGPAPTPAPAPRPTVGPGAPQAAPTPAPAQAARPIPPLPAPAPRKAPELPAFGRLQHVGGSQVYALTSDTVRIGRSSPADGINPEIDLTDLDSKGTVSRRHAIITREGDHVYLEDSGSINGTHVNGARLASGVQRPLQEGDQVCFGDVAFHYHYVK